MLRERFKAQAHAASARQERAVAEAAVDPDAVARILDGFVQGVDADGLTLFRRLKEAGQVVVEAADAEMAYVGYSITVPKISFIPAFNVPSVFLGLAPLYEQEDLLILHATAPTPTIGTSYEEVAQQLDAAIDGLQGRETPATLVIVPNDWLMTVALLQHDGQADLPGQGVDLGTYRGVPLLNGPAWAEDRQTCFVVALPALARLHVWAPPVDADVRHGRVLVELRAPEANELEAERQQPPPRSSAGLPYRGEDMEAALRNQWRLRVEAYLRVEVLDAGAIAAVRYEPDGAGVKPVPQPPAAAPVPKQRQAAPGPTEADS